MPQTRRNFIKFAVAGSVAAGCPIDRLFLRNPRGNRPIGWLKAITSRLFMTCATGILFPSRNLRAKSIY